MDYKKIIRSRATRVAIMRAAGFVPDKLMLQIQYRIKTKRKLDLDNPQRFTEKLQWYKLYYRDPLMAQCVDKYEVRKYVKSCGLSENLIPILGVYSKPEDVIWNELPQQFVAKDTLGGGGNDVILCADKTALNRDELYKNFKRWASQPIKGKHPGREWVYDGIPHRILIEKYIPSDATAGGLIDYKFFCFNGKVGCLYVIADRKLGKGAGLGIFTPEFEKLNCNRVDEQPLERTVDKPGNYNQLLDIAETLARPFPEARIDLYDQNGKIMFGEITFFDGSGYMVFEPDEFDLMMGEKFLLPHKNRGEK